MKNEDWLTELLNKNDEEVKMSPKQKEIVKAAIDIFSEKGFAATSTSEIAKKAGVAEGTIFRHYKTKKDLLISIVTPTLTKIVAPFFAKSFVKDVFEKEYETFEAFLRVITKNRFEFARKNIPMIKIFLQEIAFHPELKEQFTSVFTGHVLEHVRKMMNHFQEKGEIVRKVPIDTVIRFMISTVLGYVLMRFLIAPDQEWNDDEELEYTIQLILKGLQAE